MDLLSKAKLKLFASLQQKKYRYEHGLFLAEGQKMLHEALRSDFEVVAVVFRNNESAQLVENLPKDKAFVLDKPGFKRLSNQVHPEGVMTVLKIPAAPDFIRITDGNERVSGKAFILEDIRDPGNLGTLIRTADWFGFEQIICSAGTVDWFNPKVVRAAMGSLFRVKAIYVKDLPAFVACNQNDIWLADMSGTAVNACNMQEKRMVLLGNEANGVSEELRNMEGLAKVTIPRIGMAESLNVGIAAGVLAARMSLG